MWFLLQKRYLPSLGAGISAIAVVVAVYLVAPEHKVRAAWVSCAIGSVIAALLAVGDQVAAISAISAGLLATSLLTLLNRKAVDVGTGHVA
jgi:hypothetical protein